MTQRYFITGEVANDDFFTEEMSADYKDSELSYILFYSDEFQSVVTPSAGTVTYTQSPDNINYRDVPQGSFLAADSYDPARIPPNGTGLTTMGKLNLSGVTGATHFKACVWRS